MTATTIIRITKPKGPTSIETIVSRHPMIETMLGPIIAPIVVSGKVNTTNLAIIIQKHVAATPGTIFTTMIETCGAAVAREAAKVTVVTKAMIEAKAIGMATCQRARSPVILLPLANGGAHTAA